MHYYVNNKSDVYSCCVDATKAFDMVKHDKMFELLIERKIPALALRALLDMYQRQKMRTVWSGVFSRLFGTSNGIRQSGIVSQVLFCVYMDTLLKRLETKGYGCWIGSHYFGSVGYADDLKLLSPTIYGLRKMTVFCEEFGEEYGVQYNPTKTVCILYARKASKVNSRVDMCVTELPLVNTFKHLSNYLDNNLSEESEIIKKKGDLIQRFNNLIVSLGRSSDMAIKKALWCS